MLEIKTQLTSLENQSGPQIPQAHFTSADTSAPRKEISSTLPDWKRSLTAAELARPEAAAFSMRALSTPASWSTTCSNTTRLHGSQQA